MDILVELIYLVSAILFVVGLKRLQSPATARGGNALAALAMLLAIVATLVDTEILSWTGILVGVALGGSVGAVGARVVKMTDMPQMVGIFNGFGGGASALVAVAEYLLAPGAVGLGTTGVTIVLGTLIGSVTFSGSFIAFMKLQGLMTGNPITFPGQNFFNALLFAAVLATGAMALGVGGADPVTLFYALIGLSLLMGVTLVIPIGGADMPVVISLLNSYSGLAASAAGFVIGNMVLIISGALVGASGLILTMLMCKGMNRSLANVAFGAFGGTAATASSGEIGKRPVKRADAEMVAAELGYVNSVIVVPGYGLAVAQAQHELRKVGDLLEARGVDVKYAVHPVAGRMPGHMNVLLAEADVPYDKLYDLDEINDDFANTDAVLIVGANDVCNPAARDPDSIIAGMPIMDVDRARRTIVMKRSLSPGFAGIDNDLFYMDHNLMFFGDAKDSMSDLVREIRELA